jgi:sorting nexin-29
MIVNKMAMMSAVVPSGSSLNSSGSPGLLEQQESDRQRLLSALLNAVKACQTRFGGRSQLATESEPCVAALCASLEAVLWHGLRPKPASAHNSTLR